MSLGERAREKAYWILDSIKGGNVRRHYDEVMKYYDQGISDAEVDKKMQKLFQHAITTTSYYSFLKDKKDLTLNDFPLMNKMEYINHFDEIRSDVYKDAKDNVTMTTSGSTGIPFSIIQDKNKVDRNTAVSLVLNLKGGYQLGDKRAFLRVWANTNKKSFIRKVMENLITIDATVLDDARLQETCDILLKKHVKSLTGYSASLVDLVSYIEVHNIDMSSVHLNSVFTISETLDEGDKERLRKIFRCPVNSFYSSQENGNMSLQDGGEDYRLDTSTWYIEILKFDSDEPAEEGELGRIVVTDLYNYGLPMIRYDNGDVACYYRRKVEGTDCYKTYLSKVYGRRMDMVYDINGKPVSPHTLTVKMRGIENLCQWKFVQEDENHYIFMLNCNGPVDTELIQSRFKEICGDYLSFEYVNEIPVLASGKRKLVENRMNKK